MPIRTTAIRLTVATACAVGSLALPLPLPVSVAPVSAVPGTAAAGASDAAIGMPADTPVASGSRRLVVTLDGPSSARSVEATLRQWGVTVVSRLRHGLHALVVDLSPEQAIDTRRLPGVESVTLPAPMRAAGTQASPPWGLDRIDQATSTNGTYRYPDQAGNGVTVYVIDTGVRATHTDFGGRVVPGWWYDFGDESPDPFDTPCRNGAAQGGAADDNGHGTHVAGTVGGSTYGVAKQVTIVPVKVLDCNGSSSGPSVGLGIDWVIGDHDPGELAVANLSLSGGFDPVLNALVQAMVDDGITVVVAAGNNNADACSYSPASSAAAITVGATELTTSKTDQRASFSNFGSCLDLYAPGSGVLSTSRSSDVATTTMSGTSMASPHVAGIAALLLGREPSLTPTQVWARMRSVAVDDVVAQPTGQHVPFANVPWQQLTVTKPAATTGSGTGSGTVASGDSRIACGVACSELYLRGDTVTLTATPSAGSVFEGWSGACTGTSTCTVVMSATRAVGAVFALASVGVTVAGVGYGTVVDDGDLIECGAVCAAAVPTSTTVTLTATPGPGSTFAGWSGGGCTGTTTCVVTTTADPVTVTATFSAPDTFIGLAQPVRLVDTRAGAQYAGVLDTVDTSFAAGEVRRYVPVGVEGIPAGSTLALNLTVTSAKANGNLQVYPCDSVSEPAPSSSFLNVTVGINMANSGLVRIPQSGGICVKSARIAGIIIDATGWFPALSTMRPTVAPLRLFDTRAAQLGLVESSLGSDEATPIAAGTVRRYAPLGLGGIPATGVAALAVNVVAILPAASGVLRVYPCSSVTDTLPTSTTVNYQRGVTIANSSTVPLRSGGFCVSATTAVHVLVDTPGWFPTGAGFASFVDGSPRLLVDTRSSVNGLLESTTVYDGLVASGTTRRLALAGVGGIPSSGSLGAVSVTLVAVAPTANGHLRVWPCADVSVPPPPTSAVNYRTGISIGNAAIVDTDAGGVCVYAATTTHVRVDLTGWFPPN